MEKQRFIETGNNSFFGEYLYDQVVASRTLSAPTKADRTLGAIYAEVDPALQRRRGSWAAAV